MKKIVKTYFILDENDKKAIKKQMIDLNLTSALLAKNIAVSNAYISSILNGQRRVTERIVEQLRKQGISITIPEGTNHPTKFDELKEWINAQILKLDNKLLITRKYEDIKINNSIKIILNKMLDKIKKLEEE